MSMQIIRQSLIFIILLFNCSLALANDNTKDSQVNSNWRCKYCLFEESAGLTGTIDLGIYFQSDESIPYSKYTGLNEKGSSPLLNVTAKYLDLQGYYGDLILTNTFLDNTYLNINTGFQSKYNINLSFNQISQQYESIATVYSNNNNNLTLPESWDFADNTKDFNLSDSNFNNATLSTVRDIWRIAVDYQLEDFTKDKAPHFTLSYQRDLKSGVQSSGAVISGDNAFAATGSLLANQVDMVTEQINAKVNYQFWDWNLSFNYYASIFKQEFSAISWQNPFSRQVDGAEYGQMSTAPDNTLNQLTLAVHKSFSSKNHLNLHISAGDVRQDHTLLPYTINANSNELMMPLTANNSRVKTLNIYGKWLSQFSERWRLDITYKLNDKSNKTEVNYYQNFIADTELSPIHRQNSPYSYQNQSANIRLQYRPKWQGKIELGLKQTQIERTYQSRKQTNETLGWLKSHNNLSDTLSSEIKFSIANRTGSAHIPVSFIAPQENPLMRKFNIADREKILAEYALNYMPNDSLTVDLLINYGREQYQDSPIGLQKSQFSSVLLDLFWWQSEELSLFAYIDIEQYKTSQTGSQNFNEKDWKNDLKDQTSSLGIGFEYQLLIPEFQLGFDMSFMHADEVNTLSSDQLILSLQSLPDFTIDIITVKLYGKYQINDHWSLATDLLYHDYQDQQLDDITLSSTSLSDYLLFESYPLDADVFAIATQISYNF